MMHEAPCRNDSTSVLWGEIQSKTFSSDAKNLWKPFSEYHIIINHERTFNSHIDYSDNNTFASEEDKKKLSFDPIGEHIIELRQYYLELSDMKIKDMKSAKNPEVAAYREIHSVKKKKPLKLKYPEYPENYPFSDTLKDYCKIKPKIRFQGQLSEAQAEKERCNFVGRVLIQTGFDMKNQIDSLPAQCLSDVADVFLKKLVKLLKYNKNSEAFSESDDLWDPLETTLQEIGFGGIRGLHTFYYEKVVKKHDVLLNKCLKLHNEYKKRV